MSHIAKSILKTIPQTPYADKPERHAIRLHGDGHILEGLELLESYEGERDKHGTLTGVGGIEWRTAHGKKFFVRFNEFSFLSGPRVRNGYFAKEKKAA